MHDDEESDHHPCQHHHHLLLLRLADSAATARHSVKNYDRANHDTCPSQRPAEHRRQNDRRCVNRNPGRQSALEQEEKRCQLARLAVEAVFEKFIRGVDLQAKIARHKDKRQDNHGQRQAEIELNETHAVLKRLPWRRQKGNRTRLRGHDRQSNSMPLGLVATTKVAVHILGATVLPHAIADNGAKRADQNQPVINAHGACWSCPAAIRFANSRNAPVTPAGNWRKKDSPVYTNTPFP